MGDVDIKGQLENWKEAHPEAASAPPAPNVGCSCQRKTEGPAESAENDREKYDQAKRLIFNRAYNVLKEEGGAKIVLITEDQCPPCEDASQIFESLIKEGAVEVLPYSKCTPGDKDCIAAQGITTVPVLASRDAEGKIKNFFPLAGPSTAVPLKGDAHAV